MQKNKNILVVDDSKPILEFLRRKIEASEKFYFYGADSYAAAKIALENNNFFAAIVDLELPDAQSGAAVDLVLQHNIPTIVLTGTMSDSLRDNIIKKPIVDYLQKDTIDNIEYAVKLLHKLDYLGSQAALVVDNDEIACSHIGRFFSALGLKHIECTEALDAVDILAKYPNIKIITVDYEMPNMNGAELIKKIRMNFANREFIIFGTSGIESDEVKYKFFKSGATTFLRKPITKEEFLTKLVNLTEIYEQQDRLNSYIKKIDKYIITSITDKNGVIKYASEAFCEISGYTKQELIGKKHNILRHPDMPTKVYDDLWKSIMGGKSWSGEIKNRRKDGSYYWVKANIEPIFDYDGSVTGYQAVRVDISDKKTIETMSITDELTGLYNRRFFNSEIVKRLDEAKVEKGCFSFFIMDVDNFKKYNDTYGHKMGDDVLKNVGIIMKEMLSMNGDVPFRLGGEEFGGIVHAASEEEARNNVETIREGLEGLAIEHSKNTASQYITASFGLVYIDFAKTDMEAITSEDIYIKADEVLYEAKESGRNKVVVHRF